MPDRLPHSVLIKAADAGKAGWKAVGSYDPIEVANGSDFYLILAPESEWEALPAPVQLLYGSVNA